MRSVLISGVAGLIGSHLADKMLEEGYRVVGVDNLSAGRLSNLGSAVKNKNFVFKKTDISSKKILYGNIGRIRFDAVVHLAASKKIGESGSSLKVLKNNLESTVNMLEIARKNNARFIFASTSDVYGMSEDLPFKECGNIVLGPSYIKRWSYAVSKLYCENLVFAYHQEYGLPVVVLRYFGCFGSRSNSGPSGGHIPLFISEAMRGGVLTIHGNGRQTRSMGYVGDVVRGTILAIKNKNAVGEILNIGNDEEMSVLETAEYIIKISGNKKARLEFIPHKKVFGEYKEIMRRIPNLTKAKKILGYSPSVSIREALKIVYEDSRSKK